MAVWYVLKDGTPADPDECSPDDKGVLRHKDGQEVAMRGDAYSSRTVDTEALHRDMRPEPPKRTYKTREVKAD